MLLRTLGGLELIDSSLHRPKSLLLLAYLALEGPKERQHLAALLWPETDKKLRLHRLRVLLSQVRRKVSGILEADKAQVWSTLQMDAKKFLDFVEAGRYGEALVHYGGVFLKGFDLPNWSAELEEWVYGTREFLASRAREALLRLGEEEAAQGRFEEAAKRAEAAYLLAGAPEPEPEDFVRCHALLVAGNHPRAADVRKEAQEFGIALQLSTEEARAQFFTAEAGPPAHNLPLRSTSFISRDAELIEIANLLANPECQLLTLVGPGGVGKTRLAVHAALEQYHLGRFPDGVYFVALEALTSAPAIPSVIATAIGLELQSYLDPLAQLQDHLDDKDALLILDNYEHLLDAALLPAQLLQTCPRLKLLVTSRERLNVEEEWVLEAEGLPIPPEDATRLEDITPFAAVQLFLQRAKRARRDFTFSQENALAVLRICQLTQGFPLALELAAVWMKHLSSQEIATELEKSLDFLSANTRNLPDRQKSMRAVFEHSWKLLTRKEQQLLRRLSVFRGGFRREAASEVAGATIPLLASLADKSLVRISPSGRYDYHPLLYQYTQEKLAEYPEERSETRIRHAHYYLGLAEEAAPHLTGTEQIPWLKHLEEEHQNLRAALQRFEESGQVELGLRLAGALWRFWLVRGHYDEGRRWLKAVVSKVAADEQTEALAKALLGMGMMAYAQGDYALARSHAQKSLSIRRALGEPRRVAESLSNLGVIMGEQGDYDTARAIYQEGLAIRREMGNSYGVARLLCSLGMIAYFQGDYALARSHVELSLAMRRELGDKPGIAYSLCEVGYVATEQGDYAIARACLEESLSFWRDLGDRLRIVDSLVGLGHALFSEGRNQEATPFYQESLSLSREVGDKHGIATSLIALGKISTQQGDKSVARSYLMEGLAIWRAVGDKEGICHALESLAGLAAASRQPERAAYLWGVAEALRESIHAPLPPSGRSQHERDVAAACSQLGEAAFARAWAKGRAMNLDEAIAYALEQAGA